MDSAPRIIYQGGKFYWKTRNTIDITLVEHPASDVLEIVTYDPMLDREAARLYLDSKAVVAKVDHQDIEKKLLAAQLNSISLNEKHFTHKAVFDLVASRLLVAEFSLPERRMVVALNGNDKFEVDKPAGLAPFQSPHYRTLLHLADNLPWILLTVKDWWRKRCEQWMRKTKR